MSMPAVKPIRMVSENWNAYLRDVIAPNAHHMQVNEARAAFYGGAWAAWQAMAQISLQCEGSEKIAMQLTERLYNDIVAGCHIAYEGLGGEGKL
jgi:hypothetical protein